MATKNNSRLLVTKHSGDRPLSRRALLSLMGSAAAAMVVGYAPVQARSAESGPTQADPAAPTGMPSCVVRPEQSAGPFFFDAKLNRSDIRSDATDGSIREGVPLRLIFDVSRVDGAACAPLPGAIVDVWQCDALGAYSGLRNRGFDMTGKTFLRGFQTTSIRGTAEFLTIYPGWYQARAVHIHFKIRGQDASRRSYEFVSQLYFDEAVTNQVHSHPPYNTVPGRRTPNDADFLFRRGGKQLMPSLAKDSEGYTARFGIGLKM